MRDLVFKYKSAHYYEVCKNNIWYKIISDTLNRKLDNIKIYKSICISYPSLSVFQDNEFKRKGLYNFHKKIWDIINEK
jgi:hypothetical protein